MKNMKQKGITASEVLVIMAVLAFVAGFTAFLISFTPDETDPDTYVTLCLDGHEYWSADLDSGYVLALKVTDAGLPIICSGVQ